MQNDNLRLPIWGRPPLPPKTTAYYEFQYDPPPEPIIHYNAITVALAQAQRHHEEREYQKAVALLAPIAAADGLARALLLDCIVKLKDSEALFAHFDPPVSEAEAIHVMDGLWANGKRERLGELLEMPLIADSADPSVVEIRNKYAARLKK